MLCELQLTKEEEARLDQYYHNLCKGGTITMDMLKIKTPPEKKARTRKEVTNDLQPTELKKGRVGTGAKGDGCGVREGSKSTACNRIVNDREAQVQKRTEKS